MATSADWNMWLGQGQNRQVDPLAPLNQQFGGSLTGAPAQGYGQTSINMPASEWSRWGAPTEGSGDRLPFSNFYSLNDLDPGGGEAGGGNFPNGTGATSGAGTAGSGVGGGTYPTGTQSTYPTSTPALVPATQPQAPTPQKATPPVPQLVNPKTGGAGGTPTATGWTDTSVPDLTLQSDNAANKPPALPRQQFEQTVDTLGNRGGATWDPQRGWIGGAPVAAGTTLGNTGVKTWVNYDGNRDTQLHENGENSWRRVNRWMTEGVYEHGLTPQEAHNAALARLKRDFELSGLDWRTSGYDLSNVQSAAPGQDWAKANAVGAVPAVDPKTGQPKVADPKIDPKTGQPKVDPKTGLPQTDTTPQDTGGGGGKYNPYFANDVTIDYARGDADAALAAIRQARGGRDMSGPVGKYVESQMTRALQAYLTMYDAYGNKGTDAVSRGNSGLDSLIAGLTNGQGVGDQLRGQASGMLDGMDWSGMDNEQIYNLLSLAGGAGTFGTSPVAQYQMKNALSDMADRMYQQGNTGADPTNAVLASRQGRGNFDDILAKFLAAQQGG